MTAAVAETTSARPSRLPVLLAAAIVLHNLEEWWTLPLLPETLDALYALLGLPIAQPEIATIRWALALFALLPATILLIAAKKSTQRAAFVCCMIAAMSAANAVMPHIVLALVWSGYVPGLVTAILATLPAGVAVLYEARHERWLKRRAWIGAILLGIVLLPLVLTGFWALAQL